LAANSNNGPPNAPTISGLPTIGSALVITPGSGSVPTSYERVLGGVPQGDSFSTYVYTAEDCGPWFSLIAHNAAGKSIESNRLRLSAYTQLTTPPDAIYDNTGLTLVGTKVSAQTDVSGNAHTTMVQATDANRAVFGPLSDNGAPGHINGVYEPTYLTGPASNLRGPTIATLLPDASKVWALVPVIGSTAAGSLPVADATSIYSGQCVVGSVGNHLRLSFYQVSGAAKVGFWGTGATLLAAEASITPQAPHLIRVRKNGTTVGVIVDGASEQTATCSASIAPTSEVLAFGYNGTAFFSGILGGIPIWNTPPSANIQATAAALASYLYSLTESPWS